MAGGIAVAELGNVRDHSIASQNQVTEVLVVVQLANSLQRRRASNEHRAERRRPGDQGLLGKPVTGHRVLLKSIAAQSN
jgi:hypothetical protein